MWVPVANLRNLERPLTAQASSYSAETLNNQFNLSIEQMITVYVRKTQQKLFQSLQQSRMTSALTDQSLSHQVMKMPSGFDTKLEDLVCWSVWEAYYKNPIDGWMSELTPVITLQEQDELLEMAKAASASAA